MNCGNSGQGLSALKAGTMPSGFSWITGMLSFISLKRRRGHITSSKNSGSTRRGYPAMAKIKIVWVGKTKERYLAEGINKYLKFLMPMTQISIVEVKEEKGRQNKDALDEEARKIMRQTRDYYILDEKIG